jgi:hypothetical protein
MIDDITDNVRRIIRHASLEAVALIMILVTVILSLTSSIMSIFELWTASRITATATMVSLMASFILLAIGLLLNRGEWL